MISNRNQSNPHSWCPDMLGKKKEKHKCRDSIHRQKKYQKSLCALSKLIHVLLQRTFNESQVCPRHGEAAMQTSASFLKTKIPTHWGSASNSQTLEKKITAQRKSKSPPCRGDRVKGCFTSQGAQAGIMNNREHRESSIWLQNIVHFTSIFKWNINEYVYSTITGKTIRH